MPTSLRRVALITTTLGGVTAAGLGAGAVPAAAAPSFTATSSTVITGDVTGDGLRDRIVLGRLGTTSCAVRITVGKATGGGSGATSTAPLPVRGDTADGLWCPDLGVVLSGPTPADNRLAVGFSGGAGPGMDNAFVQVFSLTTGVGVYRTGFAAQYQPGYLGTQDFNGDGWGDVWESTDQSEGFDAYLVRARTASPLYASEQTVVAIPQFVDLDHSPGVDILVTTDFGFAGNAGAVAVNGRTGAAQVLASSHDGTILNYKLTTTNINRDGYTDLRVESVPEAGNGVAPVVTKFVNRSQNGAFRFQPVA